MYTIVEANSKTFRVLKNPELSWGSTLPATDYFRSSEPFKGNVEPADEPTFDISESLISSADETDQVLLPPTHFICIPLASSHSQSLLTEYKAALPENLRDCFIRPERLHATLLVLSLENKEDENKVVEALDQLRNTLVGHGSEPPSIDLKGVHALHMRNLKATRVVYTGQFNFDVSKRVNEVRASLIKILSQKKIALSKQNKLLLHATILNTKYSNNLKYFDATDLMDSDISFGTAKLNEIRFCLTSDEEKRRSLGSNSDFYTLHSVSFSF
jgi:AKAP7 2'5' RNA ligase-like domain